MTARTPDRAAAANADANEYAASSTTAATQNRLHAPTACPDAIASPSACADAPEHVPSALAQGPARSRAYATKRGQARPRRAFSLLTGKYLADLARNPNMVASALIPLVLSFAMRFVLSDAFPSSVQITRDALSANAILGIYAMMFEAMMASNMFVAYAMVEEAEKGVARTLQLAGVSRTQMALARLTSAFAVFLLMSALCCAVLGVPANILVPFFIANALCQLPLFTLGTALSLGCRTQMDAMTRCVPLLIIPILPFLAACTVTFAGWTTFLPCGGAFDVTVSLLVGTPLLEGAGAALSFTALWNALGIAALVFALRR